MCIMTTVENSTRNLESLLLNYSQLPIKELKVMIGHAPRRYRRFEIKKATGGKRIVWQPSRSTKMLQYCLLKCFFNDFNISKACFSYRSGISSPLKKNAELHKKYRFTMHLDFSHFFPSIIPINFFSSIEHAYKISFQDEEKWIIENTCFLLKQKGDYQLAIGAPSSPVLSNIYMKLFDNYFSDYAKDKKGKYSRYADDLWFSSNKKEECLNFKQEVQDFIKTNECYKSLSLNEQKTKLLSRSVPRKITGLVITENCELKVPRNIKRYTRDLIYHLTHEGKYTDKKTFREAKRKLQGYIAFIRDNESDYINVLVMKYSETYHNALSFSDSSGLTENFLQRS